MSFTAFGGVFMPLVFFVFLFRRQWLLPLLCVAAVLQSPSVFNLSLGGERYGVTPFLLVATLVLFDLAATVRSTGWQMPATVMQRRAVALWLAFGGVSILGALLLPHVFADLGVFAPTDKQGVLAEQVPLAWSISNLAQIVNVILLMVTMLWVTQQQDPHLRTRMVQGVLMALAVSLLVGLQQRLGWNGLLPLGESFWASNPTYAQNFREWAGIVPKVSWPLTEATYASAWYAAAFGGFIAVYFANVRRNAALLGALMAIFALANSLGAPGVLVVMVYSLLLCVALLWMAARHPEWRGGIVYRLFLGALVTSCVMLAGFLVLRHYGLEQHAQIALRSVMQRWSEAALEGGRSAADEHALGLLWQTWGLGAGMGSNRASTYLAALAGNTGLIGAGLFVVALAYHCRALACAWRREHRSSALFFFGCTIAGVLAMLIAIPDQNWPIFWVLIVGGLSCLGVRPAPTVRPAVRAATATPVRSA